MNKLSLIFVLFLLSALISCAVPQNSKYPKTKIQVKLRFLGTTEPGLAPGYMTTVTADKNPWDKPGDYYANHLTYQWIDRDSSWSVEVQDPRNNPEGFTSDGGRRCYVLYHTAPILSFAYDGSATTQMVTLYVQGDKSNTGLGGFGRHGFGRDNLYFNIPAGLDPEKDIAVFTIKGHHLSVTEFETTVTFDGTEPKPTTLAANGQHEIFSLT